MNEPRITTPIMNMDGTKIVAKSNHINMSEVFRVVLHCKYEIALKMIFDRPLEWQPWRRVLGSHYVPHSVIPLDTPEHFDRSTWFMTAIYRGFAFTGQLDGWLDDAFALEEKFDGNYAGAVTNKEVHAQVLAYFIYKLEERVPGIQLNINGKKTRLPFDEDAAKRYLDFCVTWASGTSPIPYKNNGKHCDFCDLRGEDGKLVHPCPHSTLAIDKIEAR